ncbi:anti-sigma regulatory factor [Actinoplanes philippinensis]|uniref:Anti-sigma regulatory factor (Ser/Thr protein kinase) n=1 Tax=Actinoplanes philippinensis TaxID=35752 RepID=A0A1I2MUB6_9ACTN|nr:sensor histidine kinase [Actinoplanes philippinensis]GIE83249.1 anti-sigma regulatory factor [Actinoplanes philippinensis]SFF94259.1 Anti-sigma regulatory factor (Ser/Thr protein kinase) [Actinoplanes philippinensis]
MTFDHPGLLYRGDGDYLHVTTGFVREAVAAGDAVLVAVTGHRLRSLRDALSDVAGAVSFTDMATAGRNPGRIIPGLLLAFASTHAERRISVVGEPIRPGRSAVEYPACAQHEALINAVFAGRDAAILCPYDAGHLESATVDDVWRSHPVMIVDGRRRDSPSFTDPYATAARFNLPLPAAPSGAARLTYAAAGDLSRVRRFTGRHAVEAGLPGARVEDLVTAVNELAENTLVHTAGGGSVTVWVEDARFVCQVGDQGFVADPLAGRIPADPRVPGGRGLLLAHYLCDLVRLHTQPGATTIRLHMAL